MGNAFKAIRRFNGTTAKINKLSKDWNGDDNFCNYKQNIGYKRDHCVQNENEMLS